MNNLLNQFNDHSVMIIGDVMLDRYLYGNVTRISPEAPVPVLDYVSTDHKLGGAANVALNILAMGGDVFLVGLTGEDDENMIFRKLLQDAAISDLGLISDHRRGTTLKTRVMARGQHMLRVDKEDRTPPSSEIENQILHIISRALEHKAPEGIILQDYNKGLLTKTIIEETIRMARKKSIPVFVDPKIERVEAYAGCTVFKPNYYEACQILGYSFTPSVSNLEKVADDLQILIDHSLTMITLSDKGLFLKRKGKEGIYVPSVPQEIADVCGAGDTVISALTMGYLAGGDDKMIAELANIAGHIACRYPGVAPVNIDQLKSEIKD